MAGLQDAIELAVVKHRNQKDKVGAPYILHPLRLMMRMETEIEKIVAMLHDVVEDTDVTFEDLRRMGFSDGVLGPLRCLTKNEEENYDEFIDRLKMDPVARRVKLADLEDNMDIRRLVEISPRDIQRLKKYQRARALLRLIEYGGIPGITTNLLP